MSLTIFKNDDKDFQLMQTSWSTSLNPIIGFPLNQGLILNNISVVNGNNTINHKLGRKLQGWIVKRMKNAFVQLYDLQNTNSMPDKTLILHSNGSCSIDLIVF